jgi:hypothetical protein
MLDAKAVSCPFCDDATGPEGWIKAHLWARHLQYVPLTGPDYGRVCLCREVVANYPQFCDHVNKAGGVVAHYLLSQLS